MDFSTGTSINRWEAASGLGESIDNDRSLCRRAMLANMVNIRTHLLRLPDKGKPPESKTVMLWHSLNSVLSLSSDHACYWYKP